MKLIIEIESDHEMLLGPDDGASRVLRDIANDLDRVSIFTMNSFTVELRDKFGECVIGKMQQINDYTAD
jgi:hypothetical protein